MRRGPAGRGLGRLAHHEFGRRGCSTANVQPRLDDLKDRTRSLPGIEWPRPRTRLPGWLLDESVALGQGDQIA